MTHSSDIAIRSTHAISRIRGEDFSTPDSLHRTPNARTSAVLAYAATGPSPFGSGPTDVVLYRVLHEEPDLDGVPSSLRPLVAACLAKDPGQRPAPDLVLQGAAGGPATLVQTRIASGGTTLSALGL